MVSLNDSCCTSTLDRKRKRGDTRDDGYRFSKFFKKKTKSGEVKIYEKWLSPAAWKKEIDNLNIRSREYRLKNKNNPEYKARKKPQMPRQGIGNQQKLNKLNTLKAIIRIQKK